MSLSTGSPSDPSVREDVWCTSPFIGDSPCMAMQEEALKLVLQTLEDDSALSQKVLVLFVVQKLEACFPSSLQNQHQQRGAPPASRSFSLFLAPSAGQSSSFHERQK